jgi:hypothetical protein
MATFYLLPPQALLEDRLHRFLGAWFAGLRFPPGAWPAFADLAEAALARQHEVYAIFREELPEGEGLASALRHRFGAEAGDTVVEVRAVPGEGEVAVRSWRLDGPDLGGEGHPPAEKFSIMINQENHVPV